MSGFTGLRLDNATIARAQQGDSDATAALFRCFAPAVYTLALRLCQCASTADDLTQETFVAVIQGLSDFRSEASLATWIRKIAVSRCLMHLRGAWQRKASSIEAFIDDIRAPDTDEQQINDQQRLERALSALSSQARAVVWLYDVEGYTHREIADLMGKSVSFSKSCLSRAHAELRAVLDGEERCEDSQPKRCSL